MASATVIVTQRNIAERKAKVSAARALLRTLPPSSPRHAAAKQHLSGLLTELAALKASLHYYKPTDQLTADIATKRKQVQALTLVFHKTRGVNRRLIARQLRRAAKALNEMLAAAKLQQVQTGVKSPLPQKKPDLTLIRPKGWVQSGSTAAINPVGAETTDEEKIALEAEDAPPPASATEAEIEAVEAASADQPNPEFAPSEFSLSDVPDYAAKALATLEEHADELDNYTNEEGEVWYKNPIVLIGAGVAAYLILRRS